MYCRFDEDRSEGLYEERQDKGKTPDIGTHVLLHLDAEKAEVTGDELPGTKGGSILDPHILQKVIQKYCDLLQFEIRLVHAGSAPLVANSMEAPWERSRRPPRPEMFDYFKRRFGAKLNEPLDYIFFNFTEGKNGCEAAGVLFIPNSSRQSLEEVEKLDVFVKRIWICDDDAALLPEWGMFCRGVISSPDLAVTINRRHLDRKDQNYHRVAGALRDLLEQHLTEMAARRPEDFQDFLDVHGDVFRGGLAKARAEYEGSRPTWFLKLVRLLPFRVYSSQRPAGYHASLNELLEITPDQPILPKEDGTKHHLYGLNRIVPPDQQSGLRQVLADKSYPIIVPENVGDKFFLGAIGAEFEDQLRIENVEARFSSLFGQELSESERERWQIFVEFGAEMLHYTSPDGPEGKVLAYRLPQSKMPMLIHWQDVSEAAEEDTPDTERAKAGKQVTVINASNQFMQDLLKYATERKMRTIQYNTPPEFCLRACYHLALLDVNTVMPEKNFNDIFLTYMDIMNRLLKGQTELEHAKMAQDDLQKQIGEKDTEIDTLKERIGTSSEVQGVSVPDEPEKRDCAIAVVDIVGSTRQLVGMDFADRGLVFAKYVEEMRAILREGTSRGFLDKFTGDGVLAIFGVEDDSDVQAVCRRAFQFARKAKARTAEFGERDDVRPCLYNILPKGLHADNIFACRIAVAYGPVAFGRFGEAASVVGKAAVQAARICSDKDLLPSGKGGMLFTGHCYKLMGAPDGFSLVKEGFQPRGLNQPVNVYRYIE